MITWCEHCCVLESSIIQVLDTCSKRRIFYPFRNQNGEWIPSLIPIMDTWLPAIKTKIVISDRCGFISWNVQIWRTTKSDSSRPPRGGPLWATAFADPSHFFMISPSARAWMKGCCRCHRHQYHSNNNNNNSNNNNNNKHLSFFKVFSLQPRFTFIPAQNGATSSTPSKEPPKSMSVLIHH